MDKFTVMAQMIMALMAASFFGGWHNSASAGFFMAFILMMVVGLVAAICEDLKARKG